MRAFVSKSKAMSKLSEFVEKNVWEDDRNIRRHGVTLTNVNDLQSLFRDLFDEIEKETFYDDEYGIGGAFLVGASSIRTVFERFTGSDYTQVRKG